MGVAAAVVAVVAEETTLVDAMCVTKVAGVGVVAVAAEVAAAMVVVVTAAEEAAALEVVAAVATEMEAAAEEETFPMELGKSLIHAQNIFLHAAVNV